MISLKSNLIAFVAMVGIAAPALASTAPAITLKPDPPEAGDNQMEIAVKDQTGAQVSDAKVDVTVFMSAMGSMPRMEDVPKVKDKGNGLFEADYSIAMAGSWEVGVTVTKAGQKETFNYSLTTGVAGLTQKGGPSGGAVSSTQTALLPIGPERLQLLGVRFAEAKEETLTKTIRAVGVNEPDRTKRAEVNLRFAGYVEKQFQGRIGDFVKAGEPLFSVYSPDLTTAQSEFLLAHDSGGTDDALHKSAIDRLRNLGLSDADITRIKRTKKPERVVTISAPISGTLIEVNVREGSSFNQGQSLYTIGDLTKSLIVARVFQQDLADLSVGQNVDIVVPGSPGPSHLPHPGKIDFIFPNLGEGEGTGNVRVEAIPVLTSVRPGAFLDLRFKIDLGKRLVVPNDAVLFSGMHRYLFVDRGGGSLEPREIFIGKSNEEWIEVTGGLKAGERVVASGTFLLSSEAQLRSALPKWGKAE